MAVNVRTTIKVSDVRHIGNRMLANSNDDRQRERLAIAGYLEEMLHKVGQYNGFSFLASEYLPAEEQNVDNVLRPGYDDSRRYYH